jgi:hypothetical protein
MALTRRVTGTSFHIRLTNLVIDVLEEWPNTRVEIAQIWGVLDIKFPGRYTFGQVKTCLV